MYHSLFTHSAIEGTLGHFQECGSRFRHILLSYFVSFYKTDAMNYHVELRVQWSPPYLRKYMPRPPGGCLKPWKVLNPMQAMFLLMCTYL